MAARFMFRALTPSNSSGNDFVVEHRDQPAHRPHESLVFVLRQYMSLASKSRPFPSEAFSARISEAARPFLVIVVAEMQSPFGVVTILNSETSTASFFREAVAAGVGLAILEGHA